MAKKYKKKVRGSFPTRGSVSELLGRLFTKAPEDISFFGIELKVAKIDNSRPAPLFKLVSQPLNRLNLILNGLSNRQRLVHFCTRRTSEKNLAYLHCSYSNLSFPLYYKGRIYIEHCNQGDFRL